LAQVPLEPYPTAKSDLAVYGGCVSFDGSEVDFLFCEITGDGSFCGGGFEMAMFGSGLIPGHGLGSFWWGDFFW